MTIHNVYVGIGYVLWVYVLLCVLGKLLWDLGRKRRNRRHLRRLTAFFAGKGSPKHREKQLRKLCTSVREPMDLERVCNAYLKARPDYTEAQTRQMEGCLLEIFQEFPIQTGYQRAMLLRSMHRCGLRLPYGVQSHLERLWAKKL